MDVAKIIVIGVVAATGIVGHTLTLFVLGRLRNLLIKSLDPTTQLLMVSQACCELFLCTIGLPLAAWNMSTGNVWPFNMPGFCYYIVIFEYNLSYVATLHMTLIAALRCAAVMTPATHSRLTKTRLKRIAIILAPWFLGNAAAVIGYVFSWYRCQHDPYINMCNVVPFDVTSAESQVVLARLFLFDGLVEVILPIALGCILYAIVLMRLHARQRVNQQGINSAATVNIHFSSNANRSYVAVKVVALACFVNMLLQYPQTLAFMTSFYFFLAANYPTLRLLLDFMFFSAFCVTPFVYALTSRDMRGVYKQYLTFSYAPLSPSSNNCARPAAGNNNNSARIKSIASSEHSRAVTTRWASTVVVEMTNRRVEIAKP